MSNLWYLGTLTSVFRTLPKILGALLLGAVVSLATTESWAAVAYRTEFVGDGIDRFEADLQASSQLVQLQDKDAESIGDLKRRADADLPRLAKVMQSTGYYESHMTSQIDQAGDPAKVTVTVDPGPQYTLEEIKIATPDGSVPPLSEELTPAALGLRIGGPAGAGPVLQAEAKITQTLATHGFPLAKVVSRKVVIDRGTKTMSVTYIADAGSEARFGPTTLEGLGDVDRDFVERRFAWHQGDLYDAALLDKTRTALIATNLFSTIAIVPAPHVTPNGLIPMTIKLTERAARTVGAGASYNSSQGISARVFWEHRNLFDAGELLHLEATFGESKLGLSNEFRKPDFLATEQDLIGRLNLEDDTVDAYDSRRLTAAVGVERRIDMAPVGATTPTTATLGGLVQLEHAHLDEYPGSRSYSLFGLPLYGRVDDTDDLLNPTVGGRYGLTVTPYKGLGDTHADFVMTQLTGSGYLPLDDAKEYVLAASGAIGSLAGASLADIPKDHRFYAGGGGSVRGYSYQHAGPLTDNNRPIGGRSLVQVSTELRIKITDTIGLVPFIDAGTVYQSKLPDFKSALFVGAGIGARYYTPIGPVRLDIGTPLRKRDSDSPIQIYISLGQAF